MQPDPLIGVHCGSALTDVHPSCPPEVNPLLDLPAGVAEMSFKEKMNYLQQSYEQDIMRVLGLTLVILQIAESNWQWRLRERTELWIESFTGDFEENAIFLIQDALVGEAHMCWAAEALNIPPPMALEEIRKRGAKSYDFGGSGRNLLQPATEDGAVEDPELEQLLAKRHGECPPWFDPSHGGALRQEFLTSEQSLDLLAEVYAPDIEYVLGLEEILARVDSVRARSVLEQLRRKSPGISDAALLKDALHEAVAREAEFCWTASYLGLKSSLAINFVQRGLD